MINIQRTYIDMLQDGFTEKQLYQINFLSKQLREIPKTPKDYITTEERLREPSTFEIEIMKIKMMQDVSRETVGYRIWLWLFGR